MPSLREAAAQALEALTPFVRGNWTPGLAVQAAAAMDALKAALAEPEGEGNLPPPLQEPGDFDHGIGADRFKVVRGAFWWHVLIGDSPTEHGKFRSRASAEKMAADLLREFRNGAFVQHEAALAEPIEPVAWIHTDPDKRRVKFLEWRENEPGYRGDWIKTPLYTAPPRCPNCASLQDQNTELDRKLAEMEQTSLELCETCGWRTLIPGDCCLNCVRQQPKA